MQKGMDAMQQSKHTPERPRRPQSIYFTNLSKILENLYEKILQQQKERGGEDSKSFARAKQKNIEETPTEISVQKEPIIMKVEDNSTHTSEVENNEKGHIGTRQNRDGLRGGREDESMNFYTVESLEESPEK